MFRCPVCRVLLIVASLCVYAGKTPGAEMTAAEPEAKAAFLFNFAKYVEWPADAFESVNAPIGFCIIGDEAIAGEMSKIAENKTIARRKIIVRRGWIPEAKTCQVVFISVNHKQSSGTILRPLQAMPVLTVGDFDSFCEAGGIIALAMKENRIRFRVNLTAAERARLKLNSKLLALADSVKGKK